MANRWSIQIVDDWEHLGEIDTFQEGRPVIWETWLQGCQLSKINTNNGIWATVKRLRTLSKCDRLELKTFQTLWFHSATHTVYMLIQMSSQLDEIEKGLEAV